MARARVYDIQRTRLRWLRLVLTIFWIVPIALLSTLGVLVIVLGEYKRDWAVGILIFIVAGMLIAGMPFIVLYVRRETSVARLKTDFVSKVSHDLRTPLTSIRLFVETLQEGRIRDPEQERKALDLIATETRRLSAMINRLLGWAGMEAGRRTYQMSLAFPISVVEAALDAFEPQRVTGEVNLKTKLQEELPRLRVDVPAMSEALLNLLQNSIAHAGTPGQPQDIDLGCGRKGDFVAISVRDYGPGIPRKEHARIFEKFYRVTRNDAQEQVQGTGLGLAIVHHIVRAHGGRVTVESELGQGATFTILLPIPDGQSLQEMQMESP